MKPIHFITVSLITLSLTACGTTTPATPGEMNSPAVEEQPTAKTSTDIKDLRMEDALTELNQVE